MMWVSLPVIKFAVEVVFAIQLGVSDLVDWMAPQIGNLHIDQV